jgi:Restriction Endonuclease associating with ARP
MKNKRNILLGACVLAAQAAFGQAMSTADSARQAIRQRYNEISNERLDAQGYALRSELNLIPGVRLEEFQADFLQGTGNELAGKFRAAHSSSALAANTFGPWRIHPQSLHLLDESGFDVLQFEKQCPTGLGGFPPNLDLLVENPETVIGVESKFLEFLMPKQPKFTASYTRDNLPRMEECWAKRIDDLKTGPKQYLDAAQLVRHYLGLRNQPEFQNKQVILLYLFWEPENWEDFEEYRQHRKELKAFQEQVSTSDVTFIWMTYPQLWTSWDKQDLYPDHTREIRRRYLLPMEATHPDG